MVPVTVICLDIFTSQAFSGLPHDIHPPKCVSVTMATGFVSPVDRAPDFLWSLTDLSSGWEAADPALWPCEDISTFDLPFAMSVCSLSWWASNAMTFATCKGFLTAATDREAAVGESQREVPHVRGDWMHSPQQRETVALMTPSVALSSHSGPPVLVPPYF